MPRRPRHPVPLKVRAGLRQHAVALKTERNRGHLPLRVWVGLPGADLEGDRVVLFDAPDSTRLDHADRAEVSLAMVNRIRGQVEHPMCWLTRSGSPDFCPRDLEWLAASRAAWHELDLPPSFAVVTREGWLHHPSGTEQRWLRLRP